MKVVLSDEAEGKHGDNRSDKVDLLILCYFLYETEVVTCWMH